MFSRSNSARWGKTPADSFLSLELLRPLSGPGHAAPLQPPRPTARFGLTTDSRANPINDTRGPPRAPGQRVSTEVDTI